MPSATEMVKVNLTEEELAEVARALADHHKHLKDEDTRLIVRHGLSDGKNIRLLEVLGKYPGAPDERLSTYEFSPTKDLLIPGSYYFTLVSPSQLKHAIAHRNSLVLAIAREAAALSGQADEQMLLYCASGADQRFWTKIKALA
jgi:hypothetical protein